MLVSMFNGMLDSMLSSRCDSTVGSMLHSMVECMHGGLAKSTLIGVIDDMAECSMAYSTACLTACMIVWLNSMPWHSGAVESLARAVCVVVHAHACREHAYVIGTCSNKP